MELLQTDIISPPWAWCRSWRVGDRPGRVDGVSERVPGRVKTVGERKLVLTSNRLKRVTVGPLEPQSVQLLFQCGRVLPARSASNAPGKELGQEAAYHRITAN